MITAQVDVLETGQCSAQQQINNFPGVFAPVDVVAQVNDRFVAGIIRSVFKDFIMKLL